MTSAALLPLASGDETPSPRQAEVLAAALDVMVRDGDRFSMSAVAAAASCSKETLYRWFGDRGGLLTATVRWQAAKVRLPDLPDGPLTMDALHAALSGFAENWLQVLCSPVSVALNRLATAQAGQGEIELGRIVWANGPRAIAERLAPVFAAGHAAGLLQVRDSEEAFSTFFGLVVGEVQLRALLGDPGVPDAPALSARARRAADSFIRLYAA